MIILLCTIIIILLICCAIIVWIPLNTSGPCSKVSTYSLGQRFVDRLKGKDIHIKGMYEDRYSDFLTKRRKFGNKRDKKSVKR